MAIEKENIALMFDDIAPTYDKLNHLLSLNVDKSWRRKAVRLMKKAVSCVAKPKILDVACGTADSTVQIARSLPKARIDAIDVSDGMLEVGKQKVERLKLAERISFYNSRAEHIVCQNDVYDAVMVAFGVRNFADREQGLKEMLRVLKPSGTLVVVELSEPQNRLIRWFYNLYFENMLPRIGKRVSGNAEAYRYLQQSVARFPMPKEFMAMLESCGYSDVRHKALSFGLCRIYQAKKV